MSYSIPPPLGAATVTCNHALFSILQAIYKPSGSLVGAVGIKQNERTKQIVINRIVNTTSLTKFPSNAVTTHQSRGPLFLTTVRIPEVREMLMGIVAKKLAYVEFLRAQVQKQVSDGLDLR